MQHAALDPVMPQVMAIVNITPDSFFAESRSEGSGAVERRIREAVEQGASIVDIGGYSSRPGAAEVSEEEEWRRVECGLEVARRVAPEVAVSIDTFRSGIVRRAVDKFGEVIVNDISAGEMDAAMVPAVAELGLRYIAMHMRGTPRTMQSLTDYRNDIVSEVVDYFRLRIGELTAAGIARERIILDPGFGFAKTTEQNHALLSGLHRLVALGCPVVAGVSRKSMVYKVLECEPQEALAGTVALGWECLRQGATILRVHDVREAADSVRLFNFFQQNGIYHVRREEF